MKPLSVKTCLFMLAGAALLTAIIPLVLFGIPNPGFAANSFFANITFMGDAIFGLAVVFFILFFRGRKDMAIMLLFELVITLAFIQLIKNSFGGQPAHLYFEANVPASANKNIISGHSAVAFTLAFFFASCWKNRYARMGAFLLAVLVAYSRFYFGSETFFSLSLGFVPAVIARALTQLQFEKKISSVYKRKRNIRDTHGHWLPA